MNFPWSKGLINVGLLGGLTLALVACGGPATPQATDQPTVAMVEGKVSIWKGAGRVAVPGLPTVSSSVREDGTFTLTLPREAELSGLTGPAAGVMTKLGCAGDVQSSVASAHAFTVMSLDVQDSGSLRQASAVNGSKPGLLSRHVNARAWIYSDQATQLRGTVDCAAILKISQIPQLPVTVAVNVKSGWNVVELNIDASANLLAPISASGSLVNAGAGAGLTTFRTAQELQSQVGF